MSLFSLSPSPGLRGGRGDKKKKQAFHVFCRSGCVSRMFGFIKSSFCGFINHKTPLSSNSGHVTQPCIFVEDRMVGVERNLPTSTTKKRRRERKEAKTPSKISLLRSRWCKVDPFSGDEPGVRLPKSSPDHQTPLPGQPATDAGMDKLKKVHFMPPAAATSVATEDWSWEA